MFTAVHPPMDSPSRLNFSSGSSARAWSSQAALSAKSSIGTICTLRPGSPSRSSTYTSPSSRREGMLSAQMGLGEDRPGSSTNGCFAGASVVASNR